MRNMLEMAAHEIAGKIALEQQLKKWRQQTEEIIEKSARAGTLNDFIREVAAVLYRASRKV